MCSESCVLFVKIKNLKIPSKTEEYLHFHQLQIVIEVDHGITGESMDVEIPRSMLRALAMLSWLQYIKL